MPSFGLVSLQYSRGSNGLWNDTDSFTQSIRVKVENSVLDAVTKGCTRRSPQCATVQSTVKDLRRKEPISQAGSGTGSVVTPADVTFV